MPTEPGTPPRRRQSSGGMKILVGCAVIIGVFFFGSCLISAGAGIYLITTPEQIEPELLLGDQSLAALQVRADLDDPGVAGVVELLFDSLNRMQGRNAAQAGVPAPLRALQEFSNNNNRNNLMWLFPIEGVIVLEPTSTEGEEATMETAEVVAALNLQHLPRMYARSLDWISKIDDSAREQFVHHGKRTIATSDEGALCLAGGTVVVATSLGAMTGGLDRVDAAEEGAAGGAGGSLREALVRLEGPGDAELVVRLDAPEVQQVVRTALVDTPGFTGPDAPLGECRRLEGWFDLQSADSLRFHLELVCEGDPFGYDQWLELFAAQLRESLKEEGLEVELSTRELEGERPGVALDGTLAGLAAKLESALDPMEIPEEPTPIEADDPAAPTIAREEPEASPPKVEAE